jgi:hypothetical protein
MAEQEKRLSSQRRAGIGEHSAKKAWAQALVPVEKQEPRQEVAAMEREEREAVGWLRLVVTSRISAV